MEINLSSKFTRPRTWFLALTFWQVCEPVANAHEVRVHQRITIEAGLSANELSSNYREFLELVKSPEGVLSFRWGGISRNPIQWIVEGSAREDDADVAGDSGGKRSYNHFYDPLSGEGLSNFAPDRKFSPYGRDSFTWASLFDSPGLDFNYLNISEISNQNTHNGWSWQNARGYEFLGLTSPTKAVREEYLAKTFRALGDVIHLLQDTTQPQDVRDEQHLDKWIGRSSWKSPI